MEKTGFFQETPNNFSMSRLIAFINALVAAWVTLSGSSIMFVLAYRCMSIPECDIATVLNSVTIGYDYVTLVFGLWIFAYGGKNAAKYIEKMEVGKQTKQ
jgi:hypothetical protein